MSEGLEVLKKLGDEYPSEGDTLWAQYSERFSIIEKALKEGEMEHTLRVRLENINYELVREKQENEKKLKALEIIMNGCANIRVGKYETEDRYYVTINHLSSDITKEEHDLIKELINNETFKNQRLWKISR